ncbi:protein LPA2-like [Telopea speciosissima]|uniref:protein LPA2-like n=1 Tax=Telopea speciosissima TaxID=54955 RepID=UPI001CC76268|nr:protein LPA2-like [Telopea speciosissima]
MELPIHSSCFVKRHTPSLLRPRLQFPTQISLTVRVESSAQDESTNEGIEESSFLAPPKKSTEAGLGFGSSSPSNGKLREKEGTVSNKRKGKRNSERASSIIRLSPVEKPAFLSQQQGESQSEEQNRNESAFLLTWLGLGSLFLVEGILLAASGTIVNLFSLFPLRVFIYIIFCDLLSLISVLGIIVVVKHKI